MKKIIIFYLAMGLILSLGYPLSYALAVTNVGTNISTGGTLTVDGALKFTSGAANNYILSTDASGNAIWISVGTALGNSNTDSLPEGVTNKYYSAAAVDARISAQKGFASGLATLDGTGKVPSGQLPSIALNNSYAVATIAARDALTPAPGDVAIVADDGSGVSRSYVWDNVGSTWLELLTPLSLYLTKANNLSDLADTVAARSNLGLGNVTNDAQIKASTFTTNGDLIYGTGVGTYSRLGAGSAGQVLTIVAGVPSWSTFAGAGTVTTFSAGALSPLFTTSVATASTTPALSFTLSNAAAHTFFGNFTGSSATPSFSSPLLASADFANQGTSTTILHGNVAGNPSWSAVSLTVDVIGTLPIANGGTNSTATPTAGGVGYGTGTAHAYTGAGTSGQVLKSNGASAPTWTDSGGMIFSGNSNNAVVNNQTLYFPIMGNQAGSATSFVAGTRSLVSRAGTVRNCYVLMDVVLTIGKTASLTIMKNGVATSIVFTITPGGATTYSDTSNAVSAIAGDEFGVKIVTTDNKSKYSWACDFTN